MKNDIVLFGIQGSGKGTQGKILAEKFGFAYFETGGELRKLANEDSELGKKVKSIIEAGHLVPTEVVMEIVENFVSKLPKDKKAIFDGIPRSEDQARAFDAIMEKLGREFVGLHIEIPREVALGRLQNRRLCGKCKKVFPPDYKEDKCNTCNGELIKRADDTRESIEVRLDTFMKETMPIIKHYRAAGKMITVNGVGTIEENSQKTIEKLGL